MHLLMLAQFFCKDNRAGCPHASEPQVYAGRQGVCKAVSETPQGLSWRVQGELLAQAHKSTVGFL